MFKIGDVYCINTNDMFIAVNKKKETKVDIYKYIQQTDQGVENTRIRQVAKKTIEDQKEMASVIGRNNLADGNIIKVGY